MKEQIGWTLILFSLAAATVQAANETSAPGQSFYSLTPGVRRTYDETLKTTLTLGATTNVTEATGTVEEEISPAPSHYKENAGDVVLLRAAIKERRASDGEQSEVSGGYVQLLEWREGNLYLHGIRVWVDGKYSEDMNLYRPALLYLKPSVRVGESWTVGTQKNMGVRMPTVATLEGLETVTVPAGTFSNCFKVTYLSSGIWGELDLPTGRIQVEDGTVRDTIWFAREAGMVKEVQVTTSTYVIGQKRALNREEQTKALRSYTPAK